MGYTFVRQPPTPISQRAPALFLQVIVSILAGVLIFFTALASVTLGFQFLNAGKVFPGVTVAGVDISGLSPEDAAAKLSLNLTYPYSGRVVFRDGDRVWVATPAQLGMVFDPNATAQLAYRMGRSGNLFSRLNDQLNAAQVGVDLAPVMILDQRMAYAYLQTLATQIDRPVVEAHLTINGTDVIAEPGQIGRTLMIDGTLVFLSAQLQTFRDGEVPLVITETAPEVLDVTPQAELARRILSAPVVLSLPNPQPTDPGPWTLEPIELASMLKVERVATPGGATYQLNLEGRVLRERLQDIARRIDREPQNARFIFNDNTRQLDLLSEATIGRKLIVDQSISRITQAILDGQHAIELAIQLNDPDVRSDATAESLGIRELVIAYTSYFRGSSAARMQNIQAAAARFHGVLVPPGAVFSMGQTLGDISLDSGFAEALIIYGGRTIKGVGGGVCQVSTTLFRAAFFAGYPIVERYAHAYRVSYYEQNASGLDPTLAGLDATVYFPLVDFKFKNDTPYWLLMETYFNPRSQTLTWKFYSTNDGRTVQWGTSGLLNVQPAPEPAFQENPQLAKDQIRQVDWAADGADVEVWRRVFRDGQLLYDSIFRTNYQPWRAIYEYGPGTENPKDLIKTGN
ncbi:MAG: VanW family protein [Anaerolineales bacterium]